MENIIYALIGALSGGGMSYVFTWKAFRRKAKYDADSQENDVILKKHERMKSIEVIYDERIESLLKILDEKNELLVSKRETNTQFKIQIKECEEKIRLLEFEFQKIKTENNTIKKENAVLKERLNKLCLNN